MIAGVVVHARARQAPTWLYEAIDAPPWPVAPANVEGDEIRKELQLTVGQIVVDPSGSSCEVP